MSQASENDQEIFDTSNCQTSNYVEGIVSCQSSRDIYLFCPFAINFGEGQFCFHPNRKDLIEKKARVKLTVENSDQQIK